MSPTLSTPRPQLPGETLQAKAAQITTGCCIIASASLFVVASFDELSCRAGGITSEGLPCGVNIQVAGGVFFAGLMLVAIGIGVLVRGVRRPVEATGDSGWRIGQAGLIVANGIALGLMIPRYACPPDMVLSPVFRFCTSNTAVYPAPSPGLVWKFAAVAAGLALAAGVWRWRSMPWPIASALVAGSTLFMTLYTLGRTVGVPW
jgi:hypothetical protein